MRKLSGKKITLEIDILIMGKYITHNAAKIIEIHREKRFLFGFKVYQSNHKKNNFNGRHPRFAQTFLNFFEL